MANLKLVLAVQVLIAALIAGVAVYIFLNFSSINLVAALVLFGICLVALFADMWVLYSTFKRVSKRK
jgi:hypothetical protein